MYTKIQKNLQPHSPNPQHLKNPHYILNTPRIYSKCMCIWVHVHTYKETISNVSLYNLEAKQDEQIIIILVISVDKMTNRQPNCTRGWAQEIFNRKDTLDVIYLQNSS